MPASQEARDPRHQPAFGGEGHRPAQRQPPGGGRGMAPGHPRWPRSRGREAWPCGGDFSGAWFTTGNRFTQSAAPGAGLLPTQRAQVCPGDHHAAHGVPSPTVRDPRVACAVRTPAAHFPVHWVLPVQRALRRVHPLPADLPNRRPRHQCGGLPRGRLHSIPALPAGGLFHPAGQHGRAEPRLRTQG